MLLDDDHHSMNYVIWALLKTIPEMSTADASLVMLEAHNTGKGVVTLCGRDLAMSYRNALRVLQLGSKSKLAGNFLVLSRISTGRMFRKQNIFNRFQGIRIFDPHLR